jgi:hypothetical protein
MDFSADDQRLVVGSRANNNNIAAVWIYGPQANGTWAQVIGTGYARPLAGNIVAQGSGISLNNDGSLLAVGGQWDDNALGATWIFKSAC